MIWVYKILFFFCTFWTVITLALFCLWWSRFFLLPTSSLCIDIKLISCISLLRQRQLTSLLRSRSYSSGSRSTSWVGGVVAMEWKVSHSSDCERGLSLCSGGLSSPWTLLTPCASSPWTALSSNCRSKSCSLFHWTMHKGKKIDCETNYRVLPSSCLVHQVNVKVTCFTCLHT